MAAEAATSDQPGRTDVRVLVLTGYGLNCDYETEYAFRLAGATAVRVHINDLISGRERLTDYRIMAFIGGFAWADDHGAGVILATKLRHHLGEELRAFVRAGGYVIGICNGFQALVNLGLLPGFEMGSFEREVALTYNDCGNFRNQWVHLRALGSPCAFTRDIERIDLPVRHAEGKFVASPETLERLAAGKQIVLKYAKPDGTPAKGAMPWNPNGSLEDIAGICDPTGRIFGLMPHPEAFNHATNHPDWTRHRVLGSARMNAEGEGIKLFRNVVAVAGSG